MGTSEIRGLERCRFTESSVWFTLRSEEETMFCDTYNFFQLDYQSRFQNTNCKGLIFSVNFPNQKIPGYLNYPDPMSIKKSQ